MSLKANVADPALNALALSRDPRADFTLMTGSDFPNYVGELFRSLRTKLLLNLYQDGGHCVGVTSLESGVGKSTISTNLALTIAQSNARTLLVDGDLRRGQLNTLLGVQNTPGLSDFLRSDTPITEASVKEIIRSYAPGRISFIASGQKVPFASELLSSPRFAAMSKILADNYDIVIFDLPPIGVAVDPVVMQNAISKYVIVASAGATNIVDLDRKIEEYPSVKGKILGLVLNKAPIDRRIKYYKYSKYYNSTS